MSDTMKERAWEFCEVNKTRAISFAGGLAEFGQAERERAVKECAEVVECASDDDLTCFSQKDVVRRILAVAKPEPVWCDHIKHDEGWIFHCSNPSVRIGDNWIACPICGKARPQ